MKNDLQETDFFKAWLNALTDRVAKDIIEKRIWRAKNGNFGKRKSVGSGVYEMQIHYGPGYRLYYFQKAEWVYWLLVGGDKDTQANDVERAKVMKREMERGWL